MKLKNKIIVICLIFFMLISISAVSAENNNSDIITTNNDDNDILSMINLNDDEILSADAGSFADLNNTINNNLSSEIVFDDDYVYSSSDSITDGIIIEKDNLIINGNNHFIDAKSHSRMFKIYGANITLKNIVFKNGYSDYGGSIFSYGDNLTVLNCTFIDNEASKEGGAIYTYPDNYSAVINSIFINNKAGEGGALAIIEYNYGAFDVINSSFIGNSANLTKWEQCGGGAIVYMQYFSHTEIVPTKWDTNNRIISSKFINNTAKSGGAIYNTHNYYINITNSIFIGNSEKAIESFSKHVDANYNWFGNVADNMSEKPNLDGNIAISKWLYMDLIPEISTSRATISINNLYDNETGEATTYSTSNLPSITVDVDTLNVTASTNKLNLGTNGISQVGVDYVGDCELIASFENVEISRKVKSGSFSELQSLINNHNDEIIELTKDYVYIDGLDNLPDGIIISNKNNLIIDGKGHILNANSKSRIFYIDDESSYITIKNMEIVNGFKNDDNGAGIYVDSNHFSLINCTFINNTDDWDSGAAIAGSGKHAIIDKCSFINNTDIYSGGAIYWTGEDFTITNSWFENNTADGQGGAVYTHYGGNIINCTFRYNTADFGGATYNNRHLTMDNCIFIGNVALRDQFDFGGGAVYTIHSSITNSQFINNTALVAPALYVDSNTTIVDKCIFINNTAKSGNGIVQWYANGGVLSNCIFLGNDAYYGDVIRNGLGSLIADNNWLGNTWKDYEKEPYISWLAKWNKWLFLNVTDMTYDHETGKFSARLILCEYDNITKNTIYYDLDDVPSFNLTLSAQNLTLNKNVVTIGEKIEGISSYHKGYLVAQYETVIYKIPFDFKIQTNMSVESPLEIIQFNKTYLNITLTPFADVQIDHLIKTGKITLKCNDTSVLRILEGKTYGYGTIWGIKPGTALVTIKFNGEDMFDVDEYTPAEAYVVVKVTGTPTYINVTDIPSIEIDQTVNINASLYNKRDDYRLHFDLEYINNSPDIINITGKKVTGLKTGLANITVVFKGTESYAQSSFTLIFNVVRKTSEIIVNTNELNITKGSKYSLNASLSGDSSVLIRAESNNTNVATVDEHGNVVAVGVGVAKLSFNFAGDDKYTKANTIAVIVNVYTLDSHIDVEPVINLHVGENCAINATLDVAPSSELEYIVNDTSIISIPNNKTGFMYVNSEGVVKITVLYKGDSGLEPCEATVIVNVEKGETKITADDKIDLNVGDSLNLDANLTSIWENKNISGLVYSSSDESVVSITSNGMITARSEGTANITVSYSESDRYLSSEKTIPVTVTKVPTKIDVVKSFALMINENDTIIATLSPINGTLTFTSSNPNIVKVDRNGKVTAIGIGSANITVSYRGTAKYAPASETILVTVASDIISTTISVNNTINVYVDDVLNIGAVLSPSNAGNLVYTSSNPNVVKIDENGVITAVREGEANITITFNGVEHRFTPANATALVKVSKIATAITADESITINKTKNSTLSYVFSNPEAGNVVFEIEDYGIATIRNGVVIGKNVGKTNITVKFRGNNKYLSSNATVLIEVVDVETNIEASDVVLNLSESADIGAVLTPEVGKLTYSVVNSSIVEIKNGKIITHKVGETDIIINFAGKDQYRASNKTIHVTVKDIETTIEASDITVNISESSVINATLVPIDGILTFESSNDTIVKVDKNGKITGVKAGEADIIISFAGKDQYRPSNKTIHVTVKYVPTEITVNNETISLYVDGSTNIGAVLTPNAGRLNYSSSDSSIAFVDSLGVIVGLAEGNATITVSYDGDEKYLPSNKTVNVVVSRIPTEIMLNDTIVMEIGLTTDIPYKLYPRGIESDNFTFSSSDESIISINENGYVSSLTAGDVVVSVNFGGNYKYLPSSANMTIKVSSRPTSIDVDNEITIGYGENKSLGARILSKYSTVKGDLKYESSNPDIVSVDPATGVITAHKIGNATIHITFEGITSYDPSNATVKVEVTTKTTSVTLDKTSLALHVDDESYITASLSNGPDDIQFNYISSNPGVVIVNPNGKITAMGEGSATITVIYPGNNIYHSSNASLTVSVSRYSTKIISENSFDMYVLDNINLNAVLTPEEGYLTYKSNNYEITVDANGIVSANAVGSAVITISFAGDRKYLPSQKQVIVNVEKVPTSINLNDITLYSGDEYKLTDILNPSDAVVSSKLFNYESYDWEVFDVDSKGLITAYYEGSAELFVQFKGNDAYLPSNATVTVTVIKKVLSDEDYKFDIDVSDDAGEATFTLTVPDDAEGSLVVTVDGDIYAESVEDGMATLTVDELTPGDHKVTLRYTGDEKYASINNDTTIHIYRIKIDKNKDVSVVYTENAVYTVHLTRDTQAMENKTVTFKVNGNTYYAKTDMLGYASVKLPKLAAKTYTITASYKGIKVTNKIISKHIVVAKNINAKKTKALKVKITLNKVNKKYLAKKKVTLTFQGKKYTAKTNNKGVVTFTIAKSVLAKLKVGKSYTYKVTYSKDTVSKKIKIVK